MNKDLATLTDLLGLPSGLALQNFRYFGYHQAMQKLWRTCDCRLGKREVENRLIEPIHPFGGYACFAQVLDIEAPANQK